MFGVLSIQSPYLSGILTDKQRLLATRMAIPVIGSFAVYVALEVQVVYDLILDSNSVKLACVTVPFIAGVRWKRANRTGVLDVHGDGLSHVVNRDSGHARVSR